MYGYSEQGSTSNDAATERNWNRGAPMTASRQLASAL